MTALRPMGTIVIDDVEFPAKTTGEFIPAGTSITVVDGNNDPVVVTTVNRDA